LRHLKLPAMSKKRSAKSKEPSAMSKEALDIGNDLSSIMIVIDYKNKVWLSLKLSSSYYTVPLYHQQAS
jgi:hypothetical protein